MRLSNLRLGIAALGVISAIGLGVMVSIQSGLAVFIVASAAFIGVVVQHRKVERALREFTVWAEIKRESIARMTIDWDAIPSINVSTPQNHPFASDLDLPLLHRLISTATTQQGAQRLHNWLLAQTPDMPRIEAQQALIRELAPQGIFRTRLALNGRLNAKSLGELTDGDAMIEWLRRRQPPKHFGAITFLALGVALANLALIAAAFAGCPNELWKLTLLIYAGLFLYQRQRAGDLFREATQLHAMLETVGHVMFFLEARRYHAGSRLQRLAAPLIASKPGRHLRRISWLAAGASLGGDPILWLITNIAIPIDLLVAYALYQEKAALLAEIPAWLDLWYELDALASLASFADLNPDYTFPLLRASKPMLRAKALGHPLIHAESKITNDLEIGEPGAILMITGSNMSGKSTFLRTVGVNLCLAQAGGPVDAAEFEAHPFRLFSSMRISDSIPDGLSYFYAEVKRLKALLDAVGENSQFPVFFLIDEIFRGTNNRERLIGSRAYVKALIGQGAVGMVATHDLELAHLAEGNPLLQNYHFQERVEDGRLIFDFKLIPGPSVSTNALFIMQAEGLPIETEA